MKIKSLYISAQERGAGALFVSIGMMEILKRNLHKVAFFRPIVYSKDMRDDDIDFILERYALDMEYEECYGVDIEDLETMVANGEINELLNFLITKLKKLESRYDFVLVEGIRRSFITSSIDFDINLKIAQNFGSPIINVINAKNRTFQDIYDNIRIDNKNFKSQGVSHFATFVNRVSSDMYGKLKGKTSVFKHDVYLIKEVAELDMLNIADIIESLDARAISLQKNDNTRVVKSVKVAALTLDNFLEHIQEDDLVIVPADRSDIILGLLGALYSNNYPSISGIVFPFDMDTHPNIKKLIEGLDSFSLPMFSVKGDTYETARRLSKIHARLRVENDRKIALALGVFNSSIDMQKVEERILSEQSSIITPMMFEYKLFEMARQNRKRIVLPESSDERILRAAEIILRREVADIILLGKKDEIIANSMRLGLNLEKASIINHCDSTLLDKFGSVFYEMRKDKNITLQKAKDAMTHTNYFATMMVHLGYADGMVSGAISSTGETVRPALQIIKTTPDVSIVSSVFFMCLDTKVLVYGDCAINKDPDASNLAQIAISSAHTAKAFGIEPKVAMLSYSTGESGSGEDVDKVREATNIVKSRCPELLVEGPIQYDAAINRDVARKKLPDSKVAGDANVLIFPDLNTGNNTYKAVQRSSGAIAIGPVLQGLNKPVNDLSRGCLVADIVNTVAITAIQAGQKR